MKRNKQGETEKTKQSRPSNIMFLEAFPHFHHHKSHFLSHLHFLMSPFTTLRSLFSQKVGLSKPTLTFPLLLLFSLLQIQQT